MTTKPQVRDPKIKYFWKGDIIKEDKERAYYGALVIENTVQRIADTFRIGDIAHFRSPTRVPYIAEIMTFYENKAS